MEIQSKLKKYTVVFEQDMDFFTELVKMRNTEFIVDKNVFNLYAVFFSDIPREKLIVIEAIEENKVLETVLKICEEITEIPAKRNATIVSIGGGIIQDITGFVANIMYRGIKWIFVPTTLLAACDSCIGGKTSLNYKKFKNLLGTFYPPDKIYVCSHMFQTLSDKDFESGLGEVIKFNIMAGEKGLTDIEMNIEYLLERNLQIINRFVEKSLSFKKTFIEIDEFDRGERIKLNFAHTFGHAIEVISKYVIPHGTAVAIGMIMANSISKNRNLISHDIVRRCETILLRVIEIDIQLLNKPFEKYIQAIRKDKKQVGESLTAVLITKYGETCELTVVHDISQEEIRDAINYFINIYKEMR